VRAKHAPTRLTLYGAGGLHRVVDYKATSNGGEVGLGAGWQGESTGARVRRFDRQRHPTSVPAAVCAGAGYHVAGAHPWVKFQSARTQLDICRIRRQPSSAGF
jgi:hypothetical protein